MERQAKKPAKVRATLYVSEEVLEQARDAAVHLAGFPARLTLAALAENALRAELQRLKDRYNDGKGFPRRAEDLRGGRPIAA
jgi:post-segregation antitoxin (ccd killing protein)